MNEKYALALSYLISLLDRNTFLYFESLQKCIQEISTLDFRVIAMVTILRKSSRLLFGKVQDSHFAELNAT